MVTRAAPGSAQPLRRRRAACERRAALRQRSALSTAQRHQRSAASAARRAQHSAAEALCQLSKASCSRGCALGYFSRMPVEFQYQGLPGWLKWTTCVETHSASCEYDPVWGEGRVQ